MEPQTRLKVEMQQSKVCSRCGQKKDISHFVKIKKTGTMRRGTCNECRQGNRQEQGIGFRNRSEGHMDDYIKNFWEKYREFGSLDLKTVESLQSRAVQGSE